MAETGRLGTIDSRPANIILGADVTASLTQTISDPISFSQVAASSTKQFSLSHTITFISSESHTLIHRRSISDPITFVQTPNVQQGKFVSQPITFSQSAVGGIARHYSLSSPMSLTQVAYENIKNISVSTVMSLVQTERHTGPVYQSLLHNLGLAQSPLGDKGANHQTAADVLFLTQRAGRTLSKSVTQTITFTDTGKRFTGAKQTITFAQAVSVGKGGNVLHTLFLVDTAGHKAVYRRSLSSALGLVQAVTFTVNSACGLKNYKPFVGSGDPSYTPPPVAAPTLGDGLFTLTFPFVSPTSTLALRNPNFGNRDQLSFARINRVTRGGTLIVFADPNWPKIQKLLVTIGTLKQSQVDALRTFLANSLGQEIGLLDHENRQWRGFITNPDMEIVENSRNNRTVSFEFEGNLA